MATSSSGSAADLLRRIGVITDTALSRLEVHEQTRELLVRVRELLNVDIAEVMLYDDQREVLLATEAVGIEEEVRQGVQVLAGEGFAGKVAELKKPLALNRADDAAVFSPLLWQKGIRVLLGIPMFASGEVIGVVSVGTLDDREFTDQDTHLLRLVADRLALTAEVSEARNKRAVATTLQRSLLPIRLPSVPGVTLDARYVPGAEAGVGGDWYDVFELPSERIGIVIGDVVGNGLPAAIVMGRLRSALRAYALETEDPGSVLSRLDRKACHFEGNTMATVTYVIFEPWTMRLRISVAGHPPPVLADPTTSAALLEMPVALPIGLDPDQSRRESRVVELPPDGVFCLYTDGLVERRGSTLDAGFERLCHAVVPARADAVCASVMSQLVGSESVHDDIALLVLSRSAATVS